MANTSKDRDVTHLIERLEVFEERAGIRFEALSARFEPGWVPSALIRVFGEVHARSGNTIPSDVNVSVVVYNNSGQIIATDSCRISTDNFFGFEVFEVEARGPMEQAVKLRLLPKSQTP